MRVVIADENIVHRKKLRQILEEHEYVVIDEAANGLHAYNKVVDLKPDLTIMSINMPIHDGVSALKRIKQYDNNASVIMLSESGQNKEIFESLSGGALHYITKPIEPFQVIKVLDDVRKLRNGMV